MDNNLRKIRQNKDLTLDAAAKMAGTSNQHLSRLESGKSRLNVDWIEKFSEIYSVEPGEILSKGRSQKQDSNKKSMLNDSTIGSREKVSFGPDTIPLLGTANGSGDAIIINFDEEISRIMRHPNQANVKLAYAVIVYGDSMSPRFKHGEKAYINGDREPIKDQDCIIDMNDGTAYIKTFLRKTDKEIICEQINPHKEFRRPIKDVKTLHVISGRG